MSLIKLNRSMLQDALYETLQAAARGTYQRDLVDGFQAWDGSDLRGRAAQYRSGYRRSRHALLTRANAAWGHDSTIVAMGTGVHGIGQARIGILIDGEFLCLDRALD